MVVGHSNLAFLMSMFFVLSIIYTLNFYYVAASNEVPKIEGLDDKDDMTSPAQKETSGGWLSDIVSGATTNTLDFILELLSWFSPFAGIKTALYILAPSDLYQILNLILLRPIGWIGTYITIDYALNKLRGTSE